MLPQTCNLRLPDAIDEQVEADLRIGWCEEIARRTNSHPKRDLFMLSKNDLLLNLPMGYPNPTNEELLEVISKEHKKKVRGQN